MRKQMNQSTLTYVMNGITVVALLFLAFSIYCFNNVNHKIDQANEDRFELTYNANRFMNGSAYLTNEVRAYAATGQKVHYDNYWNEVNNLKNRDLGVAAMKEIGITAEEQGMIDEMSALSNELVPLEENAMDDVQAGRLDDAVDYVYGPEYSDSIAKINTIKSNFLTSLDNRAVTEINRLIGVTAIIRVCMVLSLILIGVIQLVNTLIVRKRIIFPLIHIRDQMIEISKGDLSADFNLEPSTSEIGMLVDSIHTTKRELKKYISDIDYKLAEMSKGNMDLAIGDDYRGEFRPIQDAMRHILDALNEALNDIDQASYQVNYSSEQMASGAQTLSQSATEQASSIEQLSAGIQDLLNQVSSTSQNADKARECSTEASEQLHASNEKMQNLVKAIDDISHASSEIGGIIKTIEDISFQTNILALNAAVEAARAGAAGKGFAVVADEVRNLASKSAVAAKDTTALIENTLALVEQGTALTAETTEALEGVVSGAQRSTELVEDIAASSIHQTESLQALMQGMQQITNIVQTTAATAEESAASAEELRGQADALKASVSRFQLRNA